MVSFALGFIIGWLAHKFKLHELLHSHFSNLAGHLVNVFTKPKV